MTIGDRIRVVREEFNKNQRDFASSIKIGQSTLAMFENGQREPKDIHIEQICLKYGIREDWLRYEKGEMYNERDGSFTELLSDLDDSDDDFIKSLIKVYMGLDKDSKDALRKIAEGMVEEYKRRG